MTMENQEEILMLLERFTKSKQKDIPRELEDYLNFVARTGDTLYRWVLVKPLFREKLVNVITDFHHSTPSIADIPQCPNVDPFNFERMKRALLERLDSFNSAPFTVQRICELLTEPRKQYTRIDKFMRAVEKNILVVSTQEPGRRRSDSENGDSLDSIVNGDLEVNVDIEMDNEQFHLEADALLPDSSDPVSSLHNSLADSVGASQRSGDVGSEMNGGSFMNTDAGSSQSTGKSGLNSDGHQSVIDTNENATDGDIAAPLLDASIESSSTTTTMSVTTTETTGKEDENDKASPSQETTAQIVDEAATNTDTPAQAVREEEITAAPEDLAEGADKQQPQQKDSAKSSGEVVEQEEDKVDKIKSQPVPSVAGDDDKDSTAVAQQEDDEPKAKMIKYDDDDQAATKSISSSGTTSVIKADVHASNVEDNVLVEEKSAAESSAPKEAVDEMLKATEETAAVTTEPTAALPGGEPDALGTVPTETSEPPVDNSDLKEHSKSDEPETVAAPTVVSSSVVSEPAVEIPPKPDATTTPTSTTHAAAEMEATSSIESTRGQVETGDVTSAQELEMELATVVAVSASSAVAAPSTENVVVEEVDMAGESVGQATEMAEEDTKPDDNVMDIDESSVEMMDQ
uniref:Serine/threonine-protein phosphatase 4 regulatory subunit 2 n=1 Tax=Anopheles maculatus TaxID=74869 RepID=A0A182SEZ6_9DIPT